MSSHINVSTPQHLQIPSVNSQQLPGHTMIPSHQSISSPQHSQTSSVHLQQKPSTSSSQRSHTLSLSSANTSSFQGQINIGKSQIVCKASDSLL